MRIPEGQDSFTEIHYKKVNVLVIRGSVKSKTGSAQKKCPKSITPQKKRQQKKKGHWLARLEKPGDPLGENF